ncbi:MAG: CHAT domain-containing protein [Rhodocyclaceae bacterium]|nr:CHAT domain-containing protein [Rhodocyclaceae bacterium]
MPNDTSHDIVFIVPGDGSSSSGTRGGRSTRDAPPQGLEGEVLSSIRVAGQRDGGTEQRVVARAGTDVVVLQLDGGPQLILHPETARSLMMAQSEAQRGRGANAEAPAELHVPIELRWRGLERAATATRGTSRGFLGKVLLKLFQVIRPKAADLAGSALVGLIDGQVREGVYRLSANALESLKDQTAVETIDTTRDGRRALVLAHGTFSSTSGTFSKLWSEHPGLVGALFSRFEDCVYGLDHATLGKSPIENALTLAEACPPHTRLTLLTHSRGGLVAEVLVRATGLARLGDEDAALFAPESLPAVDLDALDEDGKRAMAAALAAQRQALSTLIALLDEKDIEIERVVRVACPARGTLLASKRFDAYLSVLRWAIELAKLPVVPELVTFLGEVARQRTDPARMPGLAAMVPDSPLVQWLHAAESPARGELWVIAGDMAGDSLGSWLKTLMADAFFWTDNDLVVQTRSMYGGTPRADEAQFTLDQGGRVSHFRYFTNKATAEPIVEALTRGGGTGWRPIGPLSYAGESASGERAARGERTSDGASHPERPVAFVLPGILGSHIKRDGKRIWLGFRLLGGLKKLRYDAGDPPGLFEPDGAVGQIYDDLIEFLARTHEVVEFSYDWRRPIEEEAARLGAAVERAIDARAASGQPVRIVAHSMGGLVARTMQIERPDVWDRLMQLPGARLLMLGTPNGGSWAPMQTLSGDDTFGNTLVAFGAPFQDRQARNLMAQFPGFLQLQAALTDPIKGLGRKEAWVKLDKADRDAINDNSWWHSDLRQATIYEWGIPEQAVLDAASALRVRLDRQRDEDLSRYPGRLLLVIGEADFTPDGFEIGDEGLVYLNARNSGDGRVTRDSAMLPGVPTWRTDCNHGELPDHGSAYAAYLELLTQGSTERLSRVPPLTGARREPVVERSRPSRARLPYAPPPRPERLRLLDLPEGRPGDASTDAPLPVEIVNGDLAFVHAPLLIGHYSSSSLGGAEAAVDSLIGGTMSQSLQLGQYPDQPGTHQLFANRSANRENPLQPPQPALAVVLGLGEESTLTASGLMLSVKLAVLALAQQRMEAGDNAGTLDIASTLAGSGGSNISAGQSAQFIARGVRLADEALARLNEDLGHGAPLWPRVRSLQLIELYLNRASEAWHALTELATASPTRFRLPPQVRAGNRALPRPLGFGYRGASYDIIRAIRKDGPDAAWVVEFSAHTRRARSEVRAQTTQGALVRELVKTAARGGEPARNSQLGHTLFHLLVPVELEPTFGSTSQMLLELDNHTAEIPWELLDTPASDSEGEKQPWAIRARLVRKLLMSDFRPSVRDARRDAHVLVIGEPRCDTTRYPRLPGARREAREVARLLTTHGARPLASEAVVARISPDDGDGFDALDLINTLMDPNRDWRIVHIAGHGEPPVVPEGLAERDASRRINPRGVVLSGDTFLGPAEIRSLRVVPELVFVNCCHLAKSGSSQPGDSEHGALRDPVAFASGVAAELIRIGVRCVVAAGWAVDDDAAEAFATTFYKALLRGQRFMDAVTDARLAARNFPGDTWAAYQCYGDPDWVFLRADADSAPPPVAPQQEFAGIASTADLILALDTLTTESGRPGSDAKRLRARIRHLASRFEADMPRIGRVAEAFARAWIAAGMREKAIACYRQAIAAVDGSATLKASEQLGNQLVKLAWGIVREAARRRADGESGNGAERKQDEAAFESAIETAQKHLDEAIGMLAKLQAIDPNQERLSLLGSAMKRRAMILREAGRPAAEVSAAIKAMGDYYAQAEASCGSGSGLFYPAINTLAAELALAAGKRVEFNDQRLAAIRQSLAESLRNDPDFWIAADEITLRVFEALADGRLATAGGTLLADFAMLSARVARGSYWESVFEQLEFVFHGLLKSRARRLTGERAAALSLRDALAGYAGVTP